MSEALNEFFKHLAERQYKENDMSDVLYAGLMASESLRNIFCKVFVIEGTIRPKTLEREWSTDISEIIIGTEPQTEEVRPDFHFMTTGNETVIVEVKLFDRNYHFDQYRRIKGKDDQDCIKRLLTAHQPDVVVPPDWKPVVLWEDLIKAMEENTTNGEDASVISALANYFRITAGVENMGIVKKFEPISLLYLNRQFKRVIENNKYLVDNETKVTTEIDTRAKNFDATWSGYHYELTAVKNGQEIGRVYMYFGLVYKDEINGITIWIADYSNNNATKIIDTFEKSTDGQGIRWEFLDHGYYTLMPPALFDGYLAAEKVEKQIEILNKFFEDIHKPICRYLIGICNT